MQHTLPPPPPPQKKAPAATQKRSLLVNVKVVKNTHHRPKGFFHFEYVRVFHQLLVVDDVEVFLQAWLQHRYEQQ